MAKIPLQKIRITGIKTHYKILMQELHRKGLLHIIENEEFKTQSIKGEDEHFGVFDLARIDFALSFLSKYEKPKSVLANILSGGKIICKEEEAKQRLQKFSGKYTDIIEECERIESALVIAKNELHKIPTKVELVQGLLGLEAKISDSFNTAETKTWIGRIKANRTDEFSSSVASESNLVDIKVLSRGDKYSFFRITVFNELIKTTENVIREFDFELIDINMGLEEFIGNTPLEIISILNRHRVDIEAEIEKNNNRAEELSMHRDDLSILFDYNFWRKTKNDLQYKIFRSKQVFAFEAWIDKTEFKSLEKWVKHVFVGEVAFEKIAKTQGETPPVLLKNTSGVDSFESVVEMFALPGMKDVDPTLFVAFFFTLFFGFCLSDVGYGLLLASISSFFMVFGTYTKNIKKVLWLLITCGLAAIAGGIIFGGYFGLETQYAPDFLLNADGEFRGQLISPTIEPIKLLSLALGLGALQLLSGILISFGVKLKQKQYVEAFADPGAWFAFLVSVFVLGLADTIGVDKQLATKITGGAALVLVFTQGRDQKNWLMKALIGVYSIYDGLTAFLSNFLSYARLMALAIATGVVALVMNTIAVMVYDMMPNAFIGVIVAVLIILFGHSLNFILSLLGAFIHTARLQFIEFFGKFYIGGGKKFKPFIRVKKYLFFRD